jgi:hypothetical protein
VPPAARTGANRDSDGREAMVRNRILALCVLGGAVVLLGRMISVSKPSVSAQARQQPPTEIVETQPVWNPPARPPLGQRFEQLDRDGNGTLSRDELERPEFFGRMDRDGDGRITRWEAGAFFRARPGRRMARPTAEWPSAPETDQPAADSYPPHPWARAGREAFPSFGARAWQGRRAGPRGPGRRQGPRPDPS